MDWLWRSGCGRNEAQLLSIVDLRGCTGREQDGSDNLGNGEVVLAVAVSTHAADVGGSIGYEQGHTTTGLNEALGGVDRGADRGRAKFGHSAGARVEDELRRVEIAIEGRLLQQGRGSGWVEVTKDDTLPKVAGGGLAELCDLKGGLARIGGSNRVQTGDAAIKPEAGHGGEVRSAGSQSYVEQDADIVAAGLMNQIVEIVESSDGGIDRLRIGGIWLDGSEEDCVDAQGVEVFKASG